MIWKVIRTIAISLVILSLLSGCNMMLPKPGIQPTPMPASAATSVSALALPTQSVTKLIPIQEWKVNAGAIAWSMDSSIFAVVGDEDDSNETTGIYAYSIHSTNKLWFYHGPGIGLDLTFSPNNQVVATPFYGSVIELAVSSGKLVKEIDDQQAVGGKTCIDKLGIRFSPDGTEIFTLNTSFDNFASTAIYEWNIETNQCVRTFLSEPGGETGFELSRDGKFLVLALDAIPIQPAQGIYDKQVQVWNIATQQKICSFRDARPISLIPNGKVIAAASVGKPGAVDLWDVSSCQRIDTLQRYESKPPYSVAFSPNGQYLAIGGVETVQLWQVASRKLLFESDRLQNNVKLQAFSPNGEYLLSETDRTSINDKATITLWKITP
ncbi:MAG: hypothetical protein WCA79_04050 [Anaerolineales bacterium]